MHVKYVCVKINNTAVSIYKNHCDTFTNYPPETRKTICTMGPMHVTIILYHVNDCVMHVILNVSIGPYQY